MKKIYPFLPRSLALLLGLVALLAFQADAPRAVSTLALANTPLFLQQAVEPNVMFLIDDSGSMEAETISPYLDNGSSFDVIYKYSDSTISQRYSFPGIYSAEWNKLYYDPAITYKPWPSTTTHSFGNVSFTAASRDPMNPDLGTVDLTKVAVYYTLNAGADPNVSSSYTQHPVTDQQNFANWYTYYRSRMYMAKASVGKAISSLSGMRVGLTDIFNANSSKILVPVATLKDNQTHKENLLNALYTLAPGGNTPLRTALDGIGKYYKTTDSTAPITEPCQQNFTILMTDGYWNDDFSGAGNSDGDQGTPYGDEYKNTLADVAMFYYKGNLRPDLTAGQVQSNAANHDTNTNPHMNTFTIGFGVNGTLDSSVDPYTSSPAWPQPAADENTTVDDLWHAAVNGRGKYLSASNPQGLLDGLNAALANISSRTASAAAVSLNSTSISSTTRLYQARFESAYWTGDLLAFGIDAGTGAVNSTPAWRAQAQLDTQTSGSGWDSGRFMATWNPGTGDGISFRWDSLDASQKALLNNNGADTLGNLRLNYLRGDRSQEGNPFRTRQHVLGDIIDSQPVYVGKPPFLYNYKNYAAFRSTGGASTRPGMVYVGSNDGALHAFDASTGAEKFAFVPNGVFSKLAGLTSSNFSHQYLVDGSPTVGDVTFADDTWHTMLVGGLNNGGNSVYALDVTDPTSMSNETTLASKVLWEFTDSTLGQTFSQPVIVPVKGDAAGNTWKWVVIFGSGYNNSDGKPYLYILDAETGAELTKIDLCGSGSKISPTCDTDLPNGLGTPTAVSSIGSDLKDAVYVGDLQGNMWKVDISSHQANQWQVAYSDSGKNAPLFTAKDDIGQAQPITTAPDVTLHPKSPSHTGLMVYFGTGKYLESTDITASDQQTFYAIWDKGGPLGAFDRSPSPTTPRLVKQELDTLTVGDQMVRVSTQNTINWDQDKGWYMDLPTSGERSITNPQVVAGRVIFTTFIPDSSPCGLGGKSWLMVVDYQSGSSFSEPEMDINGDGVLDANDRVGSPREDFGNVPSGMALGDGLAASPAVIGAGTVARGGVSEIKYISKSDATITGVKERGGGSGLSRPISWREIF